LIHFYKSMNKMLQYIFGPKLFRRLAGSGGPDGHVKAIFYSANRFEKYGDTAISSLQMASSLIFYTSPLVLPFALRRGWLSPEGGLIFAKFVAGVCMVVCMSMFSRTIGRFNNSSYSAFLEILTEAQNNYDSKTKELLEKYDFQFKSWPVDFDVKEVETIREMVCTDRARTSSLLSPTDLVARIFTNTFGMSLVYPGSNGLLGLLLEGPLLEGRTKLVLEYGATRNKIRTRDNNFIDTMFVKHAKGETNDTLVVCCEGNAGFYEMGIMSTPLAAGYSTLGWNHPGFASSTGCPYPDQERNAADAVMQFAIHRLGYKPENIIVMGWSIGGYSSSFIAMNYPEIKGLILDATFDSLEPLAIPRMPAFLSGVVKHAVNNYIDLDVAGNLAKYHGPVTIFRRLRDEMITTSQLELDTNRGNHLLVNLLETRYPRLSTLQTTATLSSVLSQPLMSVDVDVSGQQLVHDDHVKQHGPSFPSTLGHQLEDEEKILMLLYLAREYMKDVDASHCTPLPTSSFGAPWRPISQN